MNPTPIGLQLYTVRDETARDFTGTLRQVAQLGYTAVEFAGYGGLSANDMRSLLDELGLRAFSTTAIDLNVPEKTLEHELVYARTIGCDYVTLPWVGPERFTLAGLPTLVKQFESIGRRCRETGLRFAYHTHDYSFQGIDDTLLINNLLDATDPALVSLEIDVYWAAYAGIDPLAFLQRRGDRVPLLHVKDMEASREMTEVGAGTLDMAAIISAAQAGGTRWFIVEHDHPTIPSLESARRSLEYLKTRIHWPE
jgi:sugar phosphate isomerase/epimerase